VCAICARFACWVWRQVANPLAGGTYWNVTEQCRARGSLLTRKRSLVRSQYRPPVLLLVIPTFGPSETESGCAQLVRSLGHLRTAANSLGHLRTAANSPLWWHRTFNMGASTSPEVEGLRRHCSPSQKRRFDSESDARPSIACLMPGSSRPSAAAWFSESGPPTSTGSSAGSHDAAGRERTLQHRLEAPSRRPVPRVRLPRHRPDHGTPQSTTTLHLVARLTVGPDQTVTTTPACHTRGQIGPSRWGQIRLSFPPRPARVGSRSTPCPRSCELAGHRRAADTRWLRLAGAARSRSAAVLPYRDRLCDRWSGGQ